MNHSHPNCLACQQPTSPSDTTRLAPCHCFPFHSHCISNHELRTRQASKTAALCCPICRTRVTSILQSRPYSPPTSRPPFTHSSIAHSHRTHPAQPPPTSPYGPSYIPPPPPLADYSLPPPPHPFLYAMQPTAPPPTPPPSKSMFISEPALPPRSDKIRVYSDMQLPPNASLWHDRAYATDSDSCRFQFAGSMNISATGVHSLSVNDRARPDGKQHTPYGQHAHSQHARKKRRRKSRHIEVYWPRSIVVLVKRIKRMVA